MTKPKYEWTAQRILTAAWFAGFTALVVGLAHPISIGLLRLLIAAAIPGLWLLGIFLLRRFKWPARGLLALGL